VLALEPGSRAIFAAPPERKPKSDDWLGGAVWFPAVERAGVYQVTLSDEAWIDLVQDGGYVHAVGNAMRHDCPGLRKSVRFEFGPGPFVLQLSGAAADTIVVAIGPGERYSISGIPDTKYVDGGSRKSDIVHSNIENL
jgi:hypothetical protein